MDANDVASVDLMDANDVALDDLAVFVTWDATVITFIFFTIDAVTK
jgi:hypothetical protein